MRWLRGESRFVIVGVGQHYGQHDDRNNHERDDPALGAASLPRSRHPVPAEKPTRRAQNANDDRQTTTRLIHVRVVVRREYFLQPA